MQKKDCQTMRSELSTMRGFIPVTERCLMYEQKNDKTGGEIIFEQFLKPKNPFSKYLKIEFKKAKVTNKEISKLFPSKTGGLTGCVSNWLNGDNVITKEQYLKIREYLNNKYLLKRYEELKKEYEELRRPFNINKIITDVLVASQETHITKNFDHETKKPETLTRILIRATTNKKNNLVVVPFAGSGTECAMAIKENCNFYGFEINKKYTEMAQKRVNEIIKKPPLFYL